MKLSVKDINLAENNGHWGIWFNIPNTLVDKFKKLAEKDCLKSIEVKEKRKNRSTDANSYAFKLMSEIAKVLTSTTEEVYKEMLFKYGVNDYCGVITETIPTLKKAFKYVEVKGKVIINGRNGVRVKCTLGSSKYDSLQMSRFIDGIKTDCDDLGIETKTPRELKALSDSWEGQQ